MTRRPLLVCSLIILALGLGSCSSSGDGMMTRAELASDNDNYCQVGSASGMAALTGPQAAYSQCMQERYTAGAAGFRPEDSYEPGQSLSLAAVGRN
jgi:hypothetical protein